MPLLDRFLNALFIVLVAVSVLLQASSARTVHLSARFLPNDVSCDWTNTSLPCSDQEPCCSESEYTITEDLTIFLDSELGTQTQMVFINMNATSPYTVTIAPFNRSEVVKNVWMFELSGNCLEEQVIFDGGVWHGLRIFATGLAFLRMEGATLLNSSMLYVASTSRVEIAHSIIGPLPGGPS